jgi:hypothetical protein
MWVLVVRGAVFYYPHVLVRLSQHHAADALPACSVGCKKTNQPAYGYLAATVFGGMLTGLGRWA